jgi:SAM-dependent methyltransferase
MGASMSEFDAYLTGSKLYGDDFNLDQIADWFEDEKEGYANLGAIDRTEYNYVYHALNDYHCYRHLPNRLFEHALGFGSAYGDEMLPISNKLKKVTIVDPSNAFITSALTDVPVKYMKPNLEGRLDLEDKSVDLITCFGVLHHIPNVSFVVRELARVAKPGAYYLLREPIVSMGDWRNMRVGLTARERGIPLPILRDIFQSSGWTIARQQVLDFPLTNRLFSRVMPSGVFNSPAATRFDALMATAFAWNYRYHAVTPWHRFRPGGASFILIRSND